MKKLFYILLIVLPFTSIYCSAQKRNSSTRPAKVDSVAIVRDSVKTIQARVEKGDDVAMNILGSWYYSGKYVQKDYKEAVKWFSKSADKGNKFAIGNFAMCFQMGNGIGKDSVMAVKLYKKAFSLGNTDLLKQHEKLAKNGNVFSALMLADAYTHGDGVKKDPVKAREMMKYASDANSTDGQLKYALACMNGKDYATAAKVFEKLAAKNHPTGIYYTGYLLFKGMGVTQNKSRGLQFLAKAASMNNPNAQYYLGKAYYEGDGIGKDMGKAVELLQKVAASPLRHDAWWLLGNAYLEGNGVTADYYRAVNSLAQLTKDKSNREKIQNLLEEKKNDTFKTYVNALKNYYVDKDYAKAMEGFKAVTKAGNVEGNTMQALCLLNPDNKKGNAKKGVKMLIETAPKSGLAAYSLGKMYEKGEQVEKDYKQAVSFISKAADLGNGDAICNLGMRYYKGEGVAQDMVKAASLLLQAESMNALTPDAARMLAECYRNKISSIPDLRDANERITALGNVSEKNNLLDFLKTL